MIDPLFTKVNAILYSPACVGTGRKPEDSFSHVAAHIRGSRGLILIFDLRQGS